MRFFQWLIPRLPAETGLPTGDGTGAGDLGSKKGGGYGTGSTIWSRGDGRGASALDHRDATVDTDALVLLPEDMEASR